jgi:hypothetical protein
MTKGRPGPRGIAWPIERERYKVGTESYVDVAARLGVNLSSVERAAAACRNGGVSWADARAEWRAKRARDVEEAGRGSAVVQLAEIRARRQQVALAALDELAMRISSGDLSARMLVAIARAGVGTGSSADAAAIVRTTQALDNLATRDLVRLVAQYG